MLKDEVEYLLEEKEKLEHELNIAILDLSNIRALNEAAMLDNIKHDENLIRHEKVLEDLKRELPLELDLMNLERTCLVDKYEFEQEIDTIVNQLLHIQVERLNEIINETNDLRLKISKIQVGMHTSEMGHVDDMHTLNKELLKKRQVFEESFRAAVKRAMQAHLDKARMNLSDDEVSLLKEKSNMLDELEIQNAGIKCLRDAVAAHEEDLRRLSTRIVTLREEANVLREPSSTRSLYEMKETEVMETTPIFRKPRLRKLRKSSSNTNTSSEIKDGYQVVYREENQPENQDLSRNQLSKVLLHRVHNMEGFLEEIHSFSLFSKIPSNKSSQSSYLNNNAFRRFKFLVAEDPDFKNAVQPLLRHIHLIVAADETTHIEDNVVGWLAYKVFLLSSIVL